MAATCARSTPSTRQGRTAAWTGRHCVTWCGERTGPHVSVAGNMLAGPEVVGATFDTFAAGTALELPERLMAAHGGGRGRRRRPARPAVGRHAAHHDRGLPRPRPARRRPRPPACPSCAACSSCGAGSGRPARPGAPARPTRPARPTSTSSKPPGRPRASTSASAARSCLHPRTPRLAAIRGLAPNETTRSGRRRALLWREPRRPDRHPPTPRRAQPS